MSDVDALKGEIKKLSARAITAKMNLHDLAEDLPVNWTTIPDVARAAHEAYAALESARKRLAALELSRIILFAAATALFAVPLGLFMAWCLVAVVNVEAFGWRLPFHLFPGQWAQVFAIALLTAFLAALAPVLRLARAAPAELLKVFANES